MRYFIEVGYNGGEYGGFQIQTNTRTIQSEVERVLEVYLRIPVKLTGASRTDAGVNAIQNYFHFDLGQVLNPRMIYNLNAMLPADIVIRSVRQVHDSAHCRFDAHFRQYKYYIYHFKNPFLVNRAWYYPYPLKVNLLQQAADLLLKYKDFTSFSKRNSQVNNHVCNVFKSEWTSEEDCLVYTVVANRFLRGMVRGMVGTMVEVGHQKLTLQQFTAIIQNKDQSKVNFSPPGKGLFLVEVSYPDTVFTK